MAKNDDYIIVSVESRKGGVGKTTIVLNLAKLLREYYHVLVLDVDVTGTSINAIQNTSVWQKSVKLLRDDKGLSINLLKFFKDQYLTGSYNMRFSGKAEADSIHVYDDYVNVIGSELYSENGALLYDPSIIFDEIHDYWLLDMIRKVAVSFSDSFDDEKKTLIILDNSPGYVGLGKSIHDMLTDMGPKRGKFLSVSSLDIQDIDSCLKAIKNIHTLTQDKEKGASFFHETINNDLSVLKEGSVEQETFDRLAIGDEALSYYAESKQNAAVIDDYQALVFNKVPLNVKNSTLVYKYSNETNKELWDVFTTVCHGNPHAYMIPYDESIHYQFFKSNLVYPKPIEDTKHERLDRQIESLKKRSQKLDEYFHNDEWRRIAYTLTTLNRDLGRLPESLSEIGLFDQASHINPAWFPESVFRTMFRQLQDMGIVSNNRDFYFPFFLPREFMFERYAKLDYLTEYPEVACAVKAIFVVLEGFLKKNERGLPVAYTMADNILKRYLPKDVSKNVKLGQYFMSCASDLQHDIYSLEKNFQIAFLETLARVMDLSDDITIICDSISSFNRSSFDNEAQRDANASWVVDKKIITKEYDFEKAQKTIRKELADSDYMAIVRQVLEPIVARWEL